MRRNGSVQSSDQDARLARNHESLVDGYALGFRQKRALQRSPVPKDPLHLAVPVPHAARLDVVDVGHFALVNHNPAKLLIAQESLEYRQLLPEPLSDRLIARVGS